MTEPKAPYMPGWDQSDGVPDAPNFDLPDALFLDNALRAHPTQFCAANHHVTPEGIYKNLWPQYPEHIEAEAWKLQRKAEREGRWPTKGRAQPAQGTAGALPAEVVALLWRIERCLNPNKSKTRDVWQDVLLSEVQALLVGQGAEEGSTDA